MPITLTRWHVVKLGVQNRAEAIPPAMAAVQGGLEYADLMEYLCQR
jgi:hypothetical protein